MFLFESNVGSEEYLKPFSWEGKNWIFFVLSSWRGSIIALKVLCKTSFENDNTSSVTKTF